MSAQDAATGIDPAREPDPERPAVITDHDPGDEMPDGDGEVGERRPTWDADSLAVDQLFRRFP